MHSGWMIALLSLATIGCMLSGFGPGLFAGPPATPTRLPLPEPLLSAGGFAEVQTIDGEVLYLRDEPTTQGEIIRYLYDRMILSIEGGPVEADGYTWYAVRTESGESGWAALAVNDVTTLLPFDPNAPTATPPPNLTPDPSS